MDIEHLSYSQLSSYLKCQRSWYLGKIRQAEEKQTWYTPIGTAFHEWIEARLKGEPEKTPEEYFYPLIEAQMKIEPDTSAWLSGGSKEDPIVEDKALRRLVECMEKATEWLEGFEVWEVEYDATGFLPDCEVPIKGFVDLIGEHPKHGPVIVDWKTGKNKPKDNFQLETYAALLEQREAFWNTRQNGGGFRGLWGMVNPDASSPRPIDLSSVNPADVGKKYQDVLEKMRKKLYQSNHSYYNCLFCYHQDNCLANQRLATKRALYYDRSAKDGYPF